MRELSLFTGAGGGLLASKLLGWRTIGYVEINEYCQKVISQRIKDGLLDEAPIFTDIRAFNREGYASSYKGMVDVVSGGFPCTDISAAKRGAKGICGPESGLWKEMALTINVIRPKFAFVENSPTLTTRGLDVVLGDLAQMGYNAKWCCLSAKQIKALHKRERIWILAYSNKIGLERRIKKCFAYSHIAIKTLSAHEIFINETKLPEPKVVGKSNDVADRVDRTKAIGNGQVPIVAATAWRILSGII